ncbi:MAG TPA: transketolase [Clostridiaceae bacterium]|nr:transketolase [Clostridiaceae bacterium]
MGDNFDAKFLREKATELRCNIIKMITIAGSGHPGGSLSAIDIITYLYYYRMRINAKDPDWEDRDRFILSKGHCAPAQYVALADKGYFPVEELWTLRDIGSILQGHPDMKKTPGIEMTTGSLGQGLSCGVGIALGGKLDGKDYKVYVMLGDGEIQSGQVWEAAMAASHYKLDNLIGIVDYNQLQCDGATNKIMNIEPVKNKWESFGWNVFETDGHDFNEIHEVFEKCMQSREKPSLIIAHTVKGKDQLIKVKSFKENF